MSRLRGRLGERERGGIIFRLCLFFGSVQLRFERVQQKCFFQLPGYLNLQLRFQDGKKALVFDQNFRKCYSALDL